MTVVQRIRPDLQGLLDAVVSYAPVDLGVLIPSLSSFMVSVSLRDPGYAP